MQRFIILVAAVLSFALSAQAQMQDPVSFSVKQEKVSDSEVKVVFTGKIAPGWHVYTTEVADGGPIRAEISMSKSEGVKPNGKLKSVGKVHKTFDEMFDMDVTYFEGTAVFEQSFTLTAPNYQIAGTLTYGACNAQNCLPPTDVDFSFSGQGQPQAAKESSSAATSDAKAEASEQEESAGEEAADEDPDDAVSAAESAPAQASLAGDNSWWTPVIDKLQALEDGTQSSDTTLWRVFLLGLLGGLIALFTPCVWPIIPMTVSFFLKRAKDKRKGIQDAVTYGVSIVAIYVLLGLLVTALWGASALNELSTNAGFNIFFFLMLLTFAASFLGGFEITLPSRFTNAVDKKSESTTGLLSIFLMAFTLSLVSFSCTGPIIGFLLVEVSTTGSLLAPALGMLGFALALALPFTLFAMFPAWLKSAPKSGNWMNCIKVCLGFLELAFSLKFLSVADLAYGWHILDREVFLSLWIAMFALLGAYLIGWIRFPHDEDEYDEMGEVIINHRTGVVRFFLALASFAFAMYMIPGLWGAPCKAVSAFAPPMNTQDFNLYENEVQAKFTDFDEGMAYAQAHHMPVMLDFTGYGCVNCRKMEAAVWTDNQVADIMNDKYVLITLYVDEKTPLPEPVVVQENGKEKTLNTVGAKWSYLQRSKFGANAQPFYVLLDNEGNPLNKSYSYDEDIPAYVDFLQTGLKNYKSSAN